MLDVFAGPVVVVGWFGVVGAELEPGGVVRSPVGGVAPYASLIMS